MKHTTILAALLFAAVACVSPGDHQKVKSANEALNAQIASLADAQRQLSAENDRLRAERADLSRRAADAAWIEDQKKKLEGLLQRYGTGSATSPEGVELVPTAEGYAFRVAGGVLFAPGRNDLTEQGRNTLRELTGSLSGRRLRVEGHTDDTPIEHSQWGTNLRLSAERALIVADFLVKSGIPAENVGIGEHRPAVVGKDAPARSKNRRVEILMLER
jgi:chemotaxis protein MotB